MWTRTHRRSVLLFLLVLGLPCLVLAILGARFIADGDELARSRLAGETRQTVDQLGSELRARLERIKLDEAGRLAADRDLNGLPRHAEVAMIGWIQDGRLLLPWDVDPAAGRFRTMLADTPFARAVAQGEQLESSGDRVAQAIGSYRLARAIAQEADERDYADLLLARAIVKQHCECTKEADRLYTALLTSETRDDHAVPLALYAARQLADAHRGYEQAFDLLERHVGGGGGWNSPVASYLQRDLIDLLEKDAPTQNQRARAQQLAARLKPVLADAEQALALQRDFQRIVSADAAGGPTDPPQWLAYNRLEWFVSIAPSLAALPPFAIAVRAPAILDTLTGAGSVYSLGEPTFSTEAAGGHLIGDGLPNLRVSFAPTAESALTPSWRRQRVFYMASLLLVVGATVIGGYLFWRDVHRELHVAEMRSQFVASVSHELRTPLTAIRMFAETLQLDRPLSADARQEYLSTIVSESERLTRLINNVLDFSRIERGQKVYRMHSTSLGPVIRNAAGAMQYPLAHQGFLLRIDVPDDLPPVRVDDDAIQQAVLNLLSNAMKYSSDKREIDLRVADAGDHAVIEVTDYGLGIAPSEHARIFDRFYRAPVQENARIPGAGLGLALVAHIVQAHGGSISVQSAPGEGSTFAIHLPVVEAA